MQSLDRLSFCMRRGFYSAGMGKICGEIVRMQAARASVIP